MRTRSHEKEILDGDVEPEPLLHSLNFMTQVNRLLGGAQALLHYFAAHDVPDEFSVLDLASGAGDIPAAVAGWAAARGKKATVLGVDLNPLCVAYASKNHASPDVRFVQGSAFDLESFGRFDYITSSMFFHHLADPEIVRLLRLMDKNARRGFLVNDLYRGWLNYGGAFMLGVFSFQPIVFNDAKLSVKRAFKEEDFERYRRESGIAGLKIERRPVFRITMGRHA